VEYHTVTPPHRNPHREMGTVGEFAETDPPLQLTHPMGRIMETDPSNHAFEVG
jgi:hypothetical protein